MSNWATEQLLVAIAAATAARECITEARLVEITGKNAKSIENSCRILRKHGLISKNAQGCHKLTPAGRAAVDQELRLRSGPKGPRSGHLVREGTLRDRAWRAMRIKGKFTIDDIVMLSVEGEERDVRSNLGKYFRALARAGFLVPLPAREAGTAPTSNGFVRYLLVRNTGPKAPVMKASRGMVYDPNTETSVVLDGEELPRVRATKSQGGASCG